MFNRNWILVLALVSALGLGIAFVELSGGLVDVPRHWWSMVPAGGLVAAGTLALVDRARNH